MFFLKEFHSETSSVGNGQGALPQRETLKDHFFRRIFLILWPQHEPWATVLALHLPGVFGLSKLLKHLKLTYYSVKSPLCCCTTFRPQCCLPDLHHGVPHAHPRVHTWQTVVRNRMSHATKGLGQSYLGSPLMNLQWSNNGPYDLYDTPASSGWLEGGATGSVIDYHHSDDA